MLKYKQKFFFNFLEFGNSSVCQLNLGEPIN